ncbi:MAG: SEC-C domain-containing protein [Bacteroidales bacterium]|nr:SEC-C domain-containing protein [Bacteroidales bacterium]
MHPEIGEYDKYSVSIDFPNGYPKQFPRATEKSKKIPRITDRHVNKDNTLCLAVEPEEKLICRNGITLKYFLDKVLVPHLSRETYRSLSGKYEDGEYSHGIVGLWEFFGDKLKTTDKKLIVNEFKIMLQSKRWPERNTPCLCGSKVKFKKCHLKKWKELAVLGDDYMRNILAMLKSNLTS